MGESVRHKYEVQYFDGIDALDFDKGPKGEWITFASGSITNGSGGIITMKLADAPISARWVRLWMTASSNTCDDHDPSDVRNCVGYAVQELRFGTIDANGAFNEAPKNPSDRQVEYCVSSIDPWHSSEDGRTGGDYQHTGFDLFFNSGITNNLPAMIPVTMLYGTPDDAAAQIAYIEKRGSISAISKWAKSPMASTPSPKITARSISSGPPPSTKSIPLSNWAALYSKA